MDTAQLTILIVNMVGFATILLALFAAMLLSHTLYKRLDAKMETPFRRLSDVLDERYRRPPAKLYESYRRLESKTHPHRVDTQSIVRGRRKPNWSRRSLTASTVSWPLRRTPTIRLGTSAGAVYTTGHLGANDTPVRSISLSPIRCTRCINSHSSTNSALWSSTTTRPSTITV